MAHRSSERPSTTTTTTPVTPPLTKRQHALHELLSSERAYASDLALVREVHIPLALGTFFFFFAALLVMIVNFFSPSANPFRILYLLALALTLLLIHLRPWWTS